jgi:3-(3-hydroxy-phenyl)propionate hydroxylase
VPEYDVAIVGCGPVGAVAANLAGQAGLSTIVIDRAPGVFDQPRAIHFDAHIMRILQQAGVADEILADTRVWKRSTFYGVDGQPIRIHDWTDDRTFGWDAHYLFYQPSLEKILRSRLARRPHVQLRVGVEAVDVAQDSHLVTLTTREVASGQTEQINARHVIAADGASSFLRVRSGISLADKNFDEPWLAIDLLCDRELGRPNESEMFCDPRRPATRVPGPGTHHRWEFMLLPGETPEQIQRPETIEALLRPWVSIDEVTILRASVYRFHALVAERWREGRIFLAGDAAHQTPPFLGQGLCHGIRDVQNLIWKMHATLNSSTCSLLDTYEEERRPHVVEIIDMAIASGKDICLLDPVAATERDSRMRQAAASGDLPRTTFQGMPPLTGTLFNASDRGELFPQPVVRSAAGDAQLMDDAIGADIAVVALETAGLDSRNLADGRAVPIVIVGQDADAPFTTVSRQLAAWFHERHARVAVLRPDRYVYALLDDVDKTDTVVSELCAAIGRT